VSTRWCANVRCVTFPMGGHECESIGEVGDAIDCRLEPHGYQRDLAGPEARAAGMVAHVAERYRVELGRSCLLGEPCGTGLRFQPRDELVMDANRLCRRDRGSPLTAGVRRTLGRTKGRPGVTSTRWRTDAPHGVPAASAASN
jgi:hypothetical protein